MANKSESSVLVCSISDLLGGAEQILFKIAQHYSALGNCKVYILFLRGKNTEYWRRQLPFAEIVCFNSNIFKFLSIITGSSFKYVFASHIYFNALLGLLRTLRIMETEYLIVRESTLVFGRYFGVKLLIYKLAYLIGYRNIDLVICQTLDMLEGLKENVFFLFGRTKVRVIPNPFDFPNEEDIFERLEIDCKFIVAAGRLISEKGFDILLDSFARLLNDFPHFKLVILGDGELRRPLEHRASELKIEQKVIFKGFVENVYPYFRYAEVCVVSSIREGFPNVLLQMMSQNEKVVSTLCAGGISRIEGLFLAEVGDLDSLYLAIRDCLNSDPLRNRELFDLELRRRSTSLFIRQISEG